MTFFVCFNLLLRFLVIEIEYYILYSDSNNKFEKAKKALAELDQKSLDQNKIHKESIEKSLEILNKQPTGNKEAAKKESAEQGQISKQDSSNVVNDGSEPTPLTDLDGGD